MTACAHVEDAHLADVCMRSNAFAMGSVARDAPNNFLFLL